LHAAQQPSRARAGFECLKEDVEEVMGLFAELLLAPALPQEKLDLAKAQVAARSPQKHRIALTTHNRSRSRA
jgi:hypothetical protein